MAKRKAKEDEALLWNGVWHGKYKNSKQLGFYSTRIQTRFNGSAVNGDPARPFCLSKSPAGWREILQIVAEHKDEITKFVSEWEKSANTVQAVSNKVAEQTGKTSAMDPAMVAQVTQAVLAALAAKEE